MEQRFDQLESPWLPLLAQHGFVVAPDQDEYGAYRRAVTVRQQTPVAEVTYLATGPHEEEEISAKGVQAVAAYLDTLAAKHAPSTVKLRFCGHSIHPLDDRQAALRAILRRQRMGIDIITMWMTNALEEANVELSDLATAMFFQWDLRDPRMLRMLVANAFKSIRQLVGMGRPVYVQLVVDNDQDVRSAAKNLCLAASICRSCPPALIHWGVRPWSGTVDVPYFIPGVCLPLGIDQLWSLRRIVHQLWSMQIPADFPVMLRHRQGGCPYAHRLSAIFDRHGRRHDCLLDESQTVATRDKAAHVTDRAKATAECIHCSLLPACEAACPRRLIAKDCRAIQRALLTIQTAPL